MCGCDGTVYCSAFDLLGSKRLCLFNSYQVFKSRSKEIMEICTKKDSKKNGSPFGENYCHYFAKANIFLNVFFML